MYRVLTHYVMMETFEIPDKELKALESGVKFVKNYSLDEKLLMLCEEDYRVRQDSRDYEIVEYSHEEE